MNLDALFDQFDQLADNSKALVKIRDLVLRLAVRGKLVEQRPEELSAKECIRGAGKPIFTVVFDESAETPLGWAALPLGCLISSSVGGGTPSKRNPRYWNGAIRWASVKDIQSDKYVKSTIDSINEEGLRNSSAKLIPAKRLIVVTRMGLGKVAINTIPVAINQDLRAIEPTAALDLDFGYILLKSLKLIGSGVTVKGITVNKLHATNVLIPPLSEQKRITAKVDELFEVCTRLETQQAERDKQHAALVKAAVAGFAEAPNLANLQLLFHPSYAIPPEELRKLILRLAVEGKVVAQNPLDELVFEDFPGLKSTDPITINGLNIPKHWSLCKYSLLTTLITSGSRGWKHFYAPSGSIFVRTQNIKTDKLILDDVAYVDLPDTTEGMRTKIRKNDILITITGSNVTKAARVEKDIPDAYVSQHIALTRPRWPEMSAWLHLCFVSHSSARGVLEKLAYGDKPGLNLNNIRDLVIPVPPLAEQCRIVDRANNLLGLVDELDEQLASCRAKSETLLSATVTELGGNEQIVKNPPPTRERLLMKKNGDDTIRRRTSNESLKLSTKSFVLRRFAMHSGYRSLSKFDCTFHNGGIDKTGASPIVLVGLNGSGKSNLIEAVAEVFCFLELTNLQWRKVESLSSRYRENSHLFELEYTIEDSKNTLLIRIRKTKKTGAEFFVVAADGTENPVELGIEQLRLLPRRIIGYSSGLNETVSHPFLRTKTIYSEEVRDAAPPEGVESVGDDTVFDTRTLYMDYESNSAILISNYIFQDSRHLNAIKEFTRVQGVSSFGITFNRKRAGKHGLNSIVRLTSELQTYLKSFALCAGMTYNPKQLRYDLEFVLDENTLKLFRQEFKTAENLFMAMHKWSLLNALILSDKQRNVYLSNDITKGALERPPSVPPSDRVFNIFGLKLRLSQPAIEIDYSGLSDGEHQFIQVFGTALLFSDPGTLFLFDEPESHFNPEWRTKFNLILNQLPNANHQEYIISTHSPFVVSGSRQENVYKFTRNKSEIVFNPVTFETYGASFDDLLRRLYSVDSLIDESVREKLENVIRKGDLSEMQDAADDLAESKEKRRLYEAIIEKEG